MADRLMPLAMACPGEVVQIADLRAGRGLARKLADMGLVPGTRVRIVNSYGPGPVVLEVKGTRLALGYGMSQKIMVTR